ncbi:MAG: hypothetical protein LBR10_12225, partial [Prevotellaceae bacterium]|nr:hypothetical protein [Prevotellaceae bacterium]
TEVVLFGKSGRNKVFILRQENNHINIEYSAKIYINFGNKTLSRNQRKEYDKEKIRVIDYVELTFRG